MPKHQYLYALVGIACNRVFPLGLPVGREMIINRIRQARIVNSRLKIYDRLRVRRIAISG